MFVSTILACRKSNLSNQFSLKLIRESNIIIGVLIWQGSDHESTWCEIWRAKTQPKIFDTATTIHVQLFVE